MSVRFCQLCEAEVEVSEGSCLLGHAVRLQPTNGSLDELRAEVDKAFSDAQLQVTSLLSASAQVPAAVPVPVGSTGVRAVPSLAATPPTAVTAAPGMMNPTTPHRVPPPPPPSITMSRMAAGLAAETTSRAGSDPITEFAPAPRMDWGPDKGKGLKRSLLRRRSD